MMMLSSTVRTPWADWSLTVPKALNTPSSRLSRRVPVAAKSFSIASSRMLVIRTSSTSQLFELPFATFRELSGTKRMPSHVPSMWTLRMVVLGLLLIRKPVAMWL